MAGIYNASAQAKDKKTGQVNKSALPNVEPLIQAGIDPKTGCPIKAVSGLPSALKDNIRKLLRIVDEQDAINRFTWYNLPEGIDSQLLERVLYYKGQGAFFYMDTVERFYFLPFALDGTIDVYGRFTGITPLPFNGTSDDGKKIKPWIEGLTLTPEYEVVMPEDLTIEKFTKSCVLLSDYCKQMSQTNISRQVLNDPLLDVMADCIPFMRTNLLNSTGVQGMRVNTQDEQSNVKAASQSINAAALSGEKYVAVIGNVDFQDLTGGNLAKSEEFMLAMQSLDNFRLGLYGLNNGGLFQKKAHMLQSESDMNSGSVGLVMQDSLTLRQSFCNIVNSIWGLNIWCDISENALGLDRNMDGMVGDSQQDTTINQGGSDNDESMAD